MSNTKNDDRLKVVPQEEHEQPEVYGMTKGKEGLKLGRRAFLGALGVGVLASTSGGKKVFAEENVNGQTCGNLRAHSQPVNSVAINSDEKFLASGSNDNTIKLWALPEGKLLQTLTGHANTVFSVAISSDGKLLASGSQDQTIKFWALPERKLLQTLTGHSKGVYSVTISPDGKLLTSGSGDNTIKLWSLPEGEPSWCLFDPVLTQKGTEVGEYRQMSSGTICSCDTIMMPAGTTLPADAVCVCHTIAVGTYTPPPPCTCDTYSSPPCTCDNYAMHYWYPN